MLVVVAEDLEHGEVQCAVAGAVMELAYAIAVSGVMLVAKGGFWWVLVTEYCGAGLVRVSMLCWPGFVLSAGQVGDLLRWRLGRGGSGLDLFDVVSVLRSGGGEGMF